MARLRRIVSFALKAAAVVMVLGFAAVVLPIVVASNTTVRVDAAQRVDLLILHERDSVRFQPLPILEAGGIGAERSGVRQFYSSGDFGGYPASVINFSSGASEAQRARATLRLARHPAVHRVLVDVVPDSVTAVLAAGSRAAREDAPVPGRQ